MEGLELTCFQIISSVGMARSLFIEAIQEAKAGNFEAAEQKINEGNENFTTGHHAHAQLIQQEASGIINTCRRPVDERRSFQNFSTGIYRFI